MSSYEPDSGANRFLGSGLFWEEGGLGETRGFQRAL